MKKMIALLLAWIMMFSVAVPAFAAEGEPSPEPTVQDTAALADGPADMQQEGTQGETAPVPEGETAPAPEGETAPVPEGETTPAPEGETTPTPEGETTPAPEGETTPVPEGETTPVPEGETTPVPEGETTPAPTEEPTPTPEAEPSATPEAEETPEPEPTEDQFILISDLPAAVGQVDVTIVKAMDLGDWTPSFTATLRGGEEYLAELTVAADGVCCSFCDVPTGDHNDYTLTISGRGFATYEQSINVGRSDGVRIQLTVGRMAGYENCAHPGILQLGDVDGNGAVDSADALLMMQAVDQQLAAEGGQTSLGFTDLNMDGVTNLADAEYLARGLDIGNLSEGMREASLEHYIPESAVAIGATEYTEATGKENLFQDNGSTFTLGRKDGGEITAASPVAVSLDMAEGAQAGVILLDNTNILSGIMEITYEDGTVAEAMIGTVPEPAAGPAIVAEEAPPAAGEAEPAPTEELPAEPEVPAEPAPETVSEVFEVPAVPMASLPGSGVSVSKDGSGNITVDLGGRKAIKRVTLKITETTDHGNLASISQVEFVNGMQDRIPEPALDIPQGVSALGASRQFTVTWSPCVNVTGYEVEISADGVTEIVPLAGTSLTVTNFNNDEVRNYTTYQIRVQSVNGAWSSGWSNAVSATPKPAGKPDKPDNVTATGGFQTVTVTWKNMKDTVTYNVYYKADGEETFTKISDLTGTSYVISGLSAEVETEYEVYVTGVNEFGESDESIHASARTTTLNPPEMPQFNLINRSADGTPGTDHITSAVIPNTSGAMVNSPLDTGAGTAWGTVDGNPASFYERATWNDGGWWNMSSTVGLIYTFDQAYEMDTIGMMSTEANMDFTYVRVRWWDADGAEHMYDDSVMRSERRTDSMGRTYFFLRMPEPITTSKIQIGVARYWAGNNRVAVTDVYFYKYDDLKRQINELYADDLHTTLVETVTEEQLNDLKARIESSVDEFNHVNPDKDQLLKEWETAWEIYHDQFMGRIIRVHTGITASGDEHGFGGLNAWQPLGVTAAAGETVTVYVGNGSLQTGGNTNLELVITQYHAEASAMSKVVAKLKVGANEVQLPEIWSSTGVESGGALYVQYTGGASSADNYAVRVSGGTAVPVLDLYHVTDAGERAARTEAYLAELQTYAAGIPTLHSQIHQGEGSVSSEVDYDYNERNCVLGATDIMLDTMMLSIPAQQVVSGCGGSAATLLTSLDAMEDMMALFYQHKGLNAGAPNAVDRIPNRHLNIRYQRMFSGAFMYASGDHIGIEWTETDDMAGCPGVQADANGLYIGGNYFGWGIAHEIGHDINQGCYAIAEITNNYFAVLAQAKDTNDSVRFDYKNVYDKVTSGTKGSAGNVFTQLGMYWQLHLAYDRGYNFKTYANYDEQLANLFYARVDAYARTPANAPKPGGVELTLQGADVDQTIMRLACAAAQKNLLDFFQRWGKTPDETTVAYASQFPEETRAIYYVCDDSRRYTLEHSGPSKLNADGTTQAVGPITVAVDANQANKVNISIAPGAVVSEEEVLGYEIVRCTIAGGKVEKRTVGFTTESTFEDVVYAMNNRTVYYEVTLVDQYLNRSACVVTETVKIQHEGDLDKTSWTVATTGLTPDPTDVGTTGGDEDMPEVMEEDVALRMVDGKVETIYKATVAENACIEVDFHDTQVVTGFRYTAGSGTPIGGYAVDVCQNGEWQRVDTGELGGSKTVYFSNADGKYVSTYAAEALRLTLTGQVGAMISVAELDMLGLTGDNVDFGRTDSSEASIGYLTEAFQYGAEDADVIPKGSLVFTGSYKGNAAYNVVILYDQDGNVVAGEAADGSRTAYQTILSDVPETGNIQDVNDGIWIYWVQPEDQTVDFVLPKRVRVELYRVNNALTNEGERLVSDSLFVDVPTAPGDIALTANG